jgi:CheY-specific phosphatase CheX
MSTLPPEVTDAFIAAAVATLQELAQASTVFDGAPNDAGPLLPGPVLIATVQLLRSPSGTMSLVLPADTATQLAARYLPVGTELAPELVADVAGEFANVIAGQAKTMLKGTPYHFTLSTPRVVQAATYTNRASSATAMRLASDVGELLLVVDL